MGPQPKYDLSCTRWQLISSVVIFGIGFVLFINFTLSGRSMDRLADRVEDIDGRAKDIDGTIKDIQNKLKEQAELNSLNEQRFRLRAGNKDPYKRVEGQPLPQQGALMKNASAVDQLTEIEGQMQKLASWASGWTGPLNTDINGIGLTGSMAASIYQCKADCIAHLQCQAIKFSATNVHDGKNCFIFDNQQDTEEQYQTFQVYKYTRQDHQLENTKDGADVNQVAQLYSNLQAHMPTKQQTLAQQTDLHKFVSMDRLPFDFMAQKLVMETNSGGLVSFNRKLITVQLSARALVDGIPGDFVETGVFNGGTAILMAKILQTYASPERVLWAADSFKGLPKDDDKAIDAQKDDPSKAIIGSVVGDQRGQEGEFSSGRIVFEENIKQNELDKSNRIQILEGFFSDTLPHAPIKEISFLRLDGDIYISTKQPLDILYEKVSIGGFIYVDDYGSYKGCRMAVDQYRKEHGIFDPMVPVYEGADGQFEAVWWQKRTPVTR